MGSPRSRRGHGSGGLHPAALVTAVAPEPPRTRDVLTSRNATLGKFAPVLAAACARAPPRARHRALRARPVLRREVHLLRLLLARPRRTGPPRNARRAPPRGRAPRPGLAEDRLPRRWNAFLLPRSRARPAPGRSRPDQPLPRLGPGGHLRVQPREPGPGEGSYLAFSWGRSALHRVPELRPAHPGPVRAGA